MMDIPNKDTSLNRERKRFEFEWQRCGTRIPENRPLAVGVAAGRVRNGIPAEPSEGGTKVMMQCTNFVKEPRGEEAIDCRSLPSIELGIMHRKNLFSTIYSSLSSHTATPINRMLIYQLLNTLSASSNVLRASGFLSPLHRQGPFHVPHMAAAENRVALFKGVGQQTSRDIARERLERANA